MDVTLREFSTSDLEQLTTFANNPKIAANLTDQFPHPYTKEKGAAFINMVNGHMPTRVFAITCDNDFCGAIGIHPQEDVMRKNAELGYWIAEPFWGKGIATAAIQKIIPYAFEKFDINRIYARPFGQNIASQKVLEKVGFTLEARLEKTIFKNEQFQDELIYGLRK